MKPVCVIQSGESEPLDLGLPISNLDGLRVVLDIAEHIPGKGKEQTHASENDVGWCLKCWSTVTSFMVIFCLNLLFGSRQTDKQSSSL